MSESTLEHQLDPARTSEPPKAPWFLRPSLGGFVVMGLIPAVLLVILLVRVVSAASMAQNGVQVGAAAPDFTVSVWNGAAGQQMHLASLHGSPVVINFWATWCYPCQQEAPLLTKAAQTYQQRGVVFLGLAVNTPEQDGLTFLRQHGITYATGVASKKIQSAYGVSALPITVFIGSDGTVRYIDKGQLTQQVLDRELQALTR
jgi:cytochrome c biogenesis protein CcmG/thiol:disulfide interchange protein DsbE